MGASFYRPLLSKLLIIDFAGIIILLSHSKRKRKDDYYGNYELADVYGGKKRQRFNFKYKYRFKGESKWEIVDMRSLRSVTLDQINE